MKRYFLFDCETGGLDETSTSLLTMYAKVLDSKLQELGTLDLRIEPTDGRYHLDIEAMKINKINILEHDKVAVTQQEASKQLRDFLFRHCPPTDDKLIPTGHNINLDVRFASRLLPDWKIFCSHRWLDTSAIGQFFQLVGKIPDTNSGSLAQLCQYFGIDSSKNHDAKADVEMTHLLLQAMAREGLLPSCPTT